MVIGGISEEFRDYKVTGLEGLEGLINQANLSEEYSQIFKVIEVWKKKIRKGDDVMNLYFFGANGSGKTSLATNIMLEFPKIKSIRTTAIKIQQDFFENWRIPKVGLFKGLLVIDEFGKEYKTKAEHSESIMEYILKYRAERKFLTIIISNADITFIKQRYGNTIDSILRGTYIPLKFPEIDFRLITAENKMKNYIK